MGDESGGEGPPDVRRKTTSPSLPLANKSSLSNVNKMVKVLSPQAQKIAEEISQIQYFDVPSQEDLGALSSELNTLKRQFPTDEELNAEISNLSANIRRTLNRKTTYKLSDAGPFLIIMEGIQSRVGNIHPMNMGKIFSNNSIEGISKITRKGANKIGIEFRTSTFANIFLQNDKFGKQGGYNLYIPQRLVTCRGLVRDIGDLVTEDDFYEEARATCTVNGKERYVKILNIRRMNRRTKTTEGDFEVIKWIPTNNYIVTFEGKSLPDKISIFNNEREVQRYINPVLMCINCCRFGHTKNQCRGNTRCAFCAEDHLFFTCKKKARATKNDICPVDHLDSSGKCLLTDCDVRPKPSCVSCGGRHMATDRNCVEFERQKKINETMAFYNLSFFEAAKLYPKDREQRSFQRKPEDFPTLQRSSNNNCPQATATTQSQHRRSYVSVTKKRKAIPQLTDGYDRLAHKQLLLPSSSRISSYRPMTPLGHKSDDLIMDVTPGYTSSSDVEAMSGNFKDRFTEIKNMILSSETIDNIKLGSIKSFFLSADLPRASAELY